MLALAGEINMVSQCHRAVTTEPEHQSPKGSRHSRGGVPVQPDSGTVKRRGQIAQVVALCRGEPFAGHGGRSSPEELADGSECLDVVAEDLERGE
jgi:hypothetical protein